MSLPRIACFHGGGSNAAIYTVQCTHLRDILKDDFEFVFFDAPFERAAGPGPGILPYFKNHTPFKTWFKSDFDGKEFSDGSGYDNFGSSGVTRVWKLMEEVGPRESWVAAMGFSQGTRVVGGLLLDQQIRQELGVPLSIQLRFGVLCMGSGAPMISEMTSDTMKDEPTSSLSDPTPSEKQSSQVVISTPTLHLHGLQDQHLPNGRKQLASFYDQSTTKLWDIDYHHAMPWLKSDVIRFAQMIKQMNRSPEI